MVHRHTKTTSAHIKDLTIVTQDIKDLQIITAKLAAKAVTTAKGSPAFVTEPLVAAKQIITGHGSPGFVTTALVAGRAVTDAKQDWLTQVGSKASGAYWVYPTPYIAAPTGAGLAPAVSHGAYPLYMSRLVAGSCVPVGSPGAYLYISVTSRVT